MDWRWKQEGEGPGEELMGGATMHGWEKNCRETLLQFPVQLTSGEQALHPPPHTHTHSDVIQMD